MSSVPGVATGGGQVQTGVARAFSVSRTQTREATPVTTLTRLDARRPSRLDRFHRHRQSLLALACFLSVTVELLHNVNPRSIISLKETTTSGPARTAGAT